MVALAIRRRALWVIACVVVVALVVLFGLRSCSGKVIDAGGVKVLVASHQSGGMDARISGPLRVVGGCLGVRDHVILWPNGTDVVQDDPVTIDIPDYGRFSLGDDVAIGGGNVREHSSDPVEPGDFEVAGTTVPADCAQHDIWLAS
jgi:hypothetical protein